MNANPLSVSDLQGAVRADRRASSIPLFAVGAGALTVGIINAGDVSGGPFTRFGWGQMLLPIVVFATAWGLVFVRSRRLGLGAGHDGYGYLLGGLATTILFVPIISILVGPLGAVGAGLVFLGVRSRDQWLRGVGIAFLVFGIAEQLYLVSNLMTGDWSGMIAWGDSVTPWALGVIGLTAAAVVWRRERLLAQ